MPAKYRPAAQAVTQNASGESRPNMTKRFGFKETREEREARDAQEKQNRWEERLLKEDVVKLEAELDALSRARFLAPQQKTRKNLVEKMVRDLRKRDQKNNPGDTPEVGDTELRTDAPPRLSRNGDDDDDDGDTLRGIIETETHNTSQTQFVPRKVARKHDTPGGSVPPATDEATLEEEKLLKAMAEQPDDFDDILNLI